MIERPRPTGRFFVAPKPFYGSTFRAWRGVLAYRQRGVSPLLAEAVRTVHPFRHDVRIQTCEHGSISFTGRDFPD
jgi:hypothetical protein